MTKIIFRSALFISLFLTTAFIASVFPGNAVSNDNNPVLTDKRNCGTMDRLEMMYKEDPSYRNTLQQINDFIEQYSKTHNGTTDNTVVTIPTVVHVVYNTSGQNISYEQIISQINVLNKDFRSRNSDTVNTPAPFKPLRSDAQIEFQLAKRDPNGNPTLGVTRTFTNVTVFGLEDYVKYNSNGGHDAWDRNKYLNLWVCNLGSGLLGYATFPGGNPSSDGVVIGYTCFGTNGAAQAPFNLGRTATHEIGHWFSLYHIWGDDNGACYGSDLVDDTPNQGAENYGCPGYPHVSCSNGPNGDMFMDYMDYTDDGCMNIYTQGQVTRMLAALNGPRSPLLTSNGCDPVSGIPIASFASDSTTIHIGSTIHFADNSAGIPTSWNWTFNGGNTPTSTQQNPAVTYNTPGYYTVKLKVSNSYGTDSLVRTSYVKVLGANLSTFSLVSPPSFTRIITSPGNTALSYFTWTKASSSPTVTYKWKIKKVGTQTEYSFVSNNNGTDTVIGLRNNLLDSLASLMGTTADSVWGIWRCTAFNGVDSILSTNTLIVTLSRSVIGISQISGQIPESFNLYNNYPNPFNPSTKITFDVSKTKNVKISIYDLLGRNVKTIVNDVLQPGKYEYNFDASSLASGIYYYRMETDVYTNTKKMMLIK
jgi:PKD repeat protein